jgi:hypothetical protein
VSSYYCAPNKIDLNKKYGDLRQPYGGVKDFEHINGNIISNPEPSTASTGTVIVWDSLKPFKIRWLFQMAAISQQRLNGECPRITGLHAPIILLKEQAI